MKFTVSPRRDKGSVENPLTGFTQPLGAYLVNNSQNGLLVRSARCCSGTNAAIFSPAVLSDPVDRCFLSYSINPAQSRKVTVERTSGNTWLVVK